MISNHQKAKIKCIAEQHNDSGSMIGAQLAMAPIIIVAGIIICLAVALACGLL